MLVYGYINAMVSSDTVRQAGLKFDNDLQVWSNDDGSQTISNGSKINFIVSKIHECDGTISLVGSSPTGALIIEG
jgi:hypothetical protein